MLNYSSFSPYQQRPDQYTRYLVKRNIDQLVQIGIRQATQFVNTSQTKLKALNQLKYTILIGEEAITKHTESIIKVLVKVWQMDIQNSQNIIKSIVEILGYHVKISYFVPLISNILAQQQFKNSTKNTIVLLGLLGHLLINSQGVSEHLQQIIRLVDHYQKLFVENDEGLLSIGEISKTLVASVDKTHVNEKFIHIMFTVFLDIQSTKTISPIHHQAAKKSLQQLSEKANFKTIAQLYAYEIGPILEKTVKDKQYVNWGKTSKQRFKFDTIVRYCHSEVQRFFGQILQIMQFMINPQCDVEIRMDTLVLLQYMIEIEQLREAMKPYGYEIMKKILIVAIQWKVGKPQIKIRKAGIINMIALIQASIINQQQLIGSFKQLLPALKNCMNDDWAPQLRLASCEFLEKYLMAVRQNLGDDELKQLYPALLQRLDDSQDPIRKKVTIAINVFLSCRYLKFSPSTLQYMISSIFVHFDDNSQQIQDCIGTTLKFAAKLDAKQVLTQAIGQKKKMKHQQRCQQVIQYCQQMLQQIKEQ